MKVIGKLILVFLSFSLMGCEPEGIIPPKDMTSLIAAFYQADATLDEWQNVGSGRMNFDSLRVYRPILEAHGYTDEDFRASISYYLHDPKTLEKICTRARDELLVMADQKQGGALVDVEDQEASLHEGVDKEDVEEKDLERKVKKQRRQRKNMGRKELKQLEEELK